MICWKLWQNWEEDQESTYGNEVWGELFIFSLPLLHISRALKKDHLHMYVVQKVLGWVKKAQHVILKNNCHCPAASPPQSWSPGSQGLIFADWEARRPLFPSILPTLAGAPSTSNSSAGWLGSTPQGCFLQPEREIPKNEQWTWRAGPFHIDSDLPTFHPAPSVSGGVDLGSEELDEKCWLMAGTQRLRSASFSLEGLLRKIYHKKYWNDLDCFRIGAGSTTASNPI